MIAEMIAPADVQADADAATAAAREFVAANKVAVVDVETLWRAVLIRVSIGERQKQIIAKLAKPKSWAHGLHAWFCALEKTALAPYAELDAYESRQITDFKVEQDRIRQVRERELFESRRREDEARAAAEAAHLETAGEHELAAAVLEEQIAAPPSVVVLPDVTKHVAKFRRYWKWRYLDNNKARAMTLIPREYLCADESKLTKYAAAMQGSAKIPGVEFYHEDVPVR